MLPLLLLLGLGLAVALGGSPEASSKQPKGPPLPSFKSPPKDAGEAQARLAFLRKVRPDADFSADGYSSKTFLVVSRPGLGPWIYSAMGWEKGFDPAAAWGVLVDATGKAGSPIDEYGRPIHGISGNPLGTLLQVAGYALPFVPGVGPAASAALATAIAIGKGESLKDAALKGARAALPGGSAAQMGFDLAVGLASGQSVDDAAVDALLAEVPGAKEGYQKAREVLG